MALGQPQQMVLDARHSWNASNARHRSPTCHLYTKCFWHFIPLPKHLGQMFWGTLIDNTFLCSTPTFRPRHKMRSR